MTKNAPQNISVNAEKATLNNEAPTMCKILRDLTGKSVNTNVQVKSKNGPALLTEAEQSEGWIENLRDVRSRNCKWKPKHPYIYRH